MSWVRRLFKDREEPLGVGVGALDVGALDVGALEIAEFPLGEEAVGPPEASD